MPRTNQSLHDWLIDQLTNTNGFGKYAKDHGYTLETNPGEAKNVSVGPEGDRIWPDVVIYDPTTKNVKRIGEVETQETVNADHAKGHWDAYGRKVSDFILTVPKSSVKDAKKIISDLGANCALWSYQIETDSNGYAKSASFSAEA
jgi:hypothetical protein